MPINYSIKSSVIDIRTDSPRKYDSFFVDTNVWFWVTYTKASSCANPPRYNQTKDYPSYINKALSIGATLYRSGLSLSEISHIIEKSECELYNKNNNANLKIKEFRHNYSSERKSTVREIDVSWGQVKVMSKLRDITVDTLKCDGLIQLIKTSKIDGYDAFLALREKEINPSFKIITDDGDFSTIPDIYVYTANRNIIESAKSVGKLIVR